ncbi:ABC-type branched-chain amino acid transport system, periplasmic component [Synechococcus sp. PCC 7502]|uniref:ABC transporter substrate-binding protein n=1 Tax=Synechococcus sp. PCC 7502 TaxID=1173263 RepID=UPI00029FEB41|nr:ABC transporter substrate-binding protein [Synechococcus sp. PCC 7502]AFY72808.1 ABC-type branched-chain amino acid transport system, periplasmic component [Synechococcus sp. PCC 7502]
MRFPAIDVKQGIKYLKYLAISLSMILLIVLGVGLLPKTNASSPISIAMVLSLSGQNGKAGQEIRQSIELYINQINQTGGINGHPLQLLALDDRGTIEGTKAAATAAVASPSLLILGHQNSELTLQVNSIYRANQLPVISINILDQLTNQNPYFFRTVPKSSDQLKFIALYMRSVLKSKTASIIRSGKSFDLALAPLFTSLFTSEGGRIQYIGDVDPEAQEQSIQTIVRQLKADGNSVPLFLTIRDPNEIEAVIVAIRRAGLTTPIFSALPLAATEAYANRFSKYKEEQAQAGFFTDNFYGYSPILLDSAGLDAQEFASQYQKTYGRLPTYAEIKFYEAAIAGVEALRQANLHLTPESLNQDRQETRNALAAINNPSSSLRGLTGTLYFNESHSSDIPIRIAQFQKRRLISAPQQFTLAANLEAIDDLPSQLQSGNLLHLGKDYFWKQDVVYAGIDINKLSKIDQRTSSFIANFYLWFRSGGNEQAEDVTFANGNNLIPNQPLFDPKKPLDSFTVNGLNYHLYEIQGEFKNTFDLRNYPFDQQKLTIKFQNNTIPSDRLIYVIDTVGLRLPHSDQNQDDQKPYQGLQQWKFKGIQYVQETFRTNSSIGDPHLFHSNNPTDYSGMSATITMQRRSVIFLSKNLLPLFLLTFVPFMTLYFPQRLSKERPPVIVSALITGIVLLVGLNLQLPDVGYTMALEYVFHTFFALSIFCIVIGIIHDLLVLKGQTVRANQLDLVSQVFYCLVILGIILLYWYVFRDSLS